MRTYQQVYPYLWGTDAANGLSVAVQREILLGLLVVVLIFITYTVVSIKNSERRFWKNLKK